MKIYITNEFGEILKSPSRCIKLNKFKLGSYSHKVKNFSDIDLSYLNNKDSGRSPTDGFYLFNSIYSEDILNIDLQIPSYDSGIFNENYYKIIYILYTDTISLETGLAFILIGNLKRNSDNNLELFPIRLGSNKNLISINDFSFSCFLELSQDQDTSFLEGPGLGKYCNIYSILNSEKDDIKYVSKTSYDHYLAEKKSSDEYSHLETIYINKFGIKIY